MKDFQVIIYSTENNIKDEIFYLNDLLASGLTQLHIRKPNTPKYLLENLLLNIDPRKHAHIVIHSHYDLLNKYALKGIHLTKKYLEKAHPLNVQTLMKTAHIKSVSLSRPVHSLEELGNIDPLYDFVTLSPLFDSISKTGYVGKHADFVDFRTSLPKGLKVYALGGITKDNIITIKEMGYDGAVVLGTIWGSEDPVHQYKEIVKMITSVG